MGCAAIVTQTLLSIGYHATLNTYPEGQRHPYLQLIHDNPDAYQPLREHGVSRTRINGRNGEDQNWSSHNTTTTLFSVLIFRVVLFGSTFLTSPSVPGLTHPLIFHSLEEYHKFVDFTALLCPFHNYASFICKEDHPFVHASWDPKDMKVVWETVTCDIANGLSSTCGPISFTQGLGVVKSMMRRMDLPKTTHATSYEVTVDLCYTGLIMFPTMDEITPIIIANLPCIIYIFIWLRALSPIDAENTTVIQRVFQDFYHSVETRLSQVEIACYDWNIVLAIHVLRCLPSFVSSLDTPI